MSDLRHQIDAAVWRQRWHSLATDVRGGWWAVALVTALIAGAGYWIVTPRSAIGTVRGTAESAFMPASDQGRDPLHATVRLENGRLVSVVLPRTEPYRADTLIELRVVRRNWWPKSVSYQFVRYVDAPPSAALQTGRGE